MEGEHQMEKELPHVQDLPMARKVHNYFLLIFVGLF